MRYRAQTPTGDYVFGPSTFFLTDTPRAVAQAIKTRLLLFAGEWFIDQSVGLDKELIFGFGTQGTRDQEVQQRILGTQGVTGIVSYSSSVNQDRKFTVAAEVTTIYGPVTLNQDI